LEGENLLPRVRVPYLHRLVLAGRGDPLAVGAEAHAPDGAEMALEREVLLHGSRVPRCHLARGRCGPLPSSRGNAFAVGAEGHGLDIAGVPCEGEDLLPRGGVPDLHLAPEPTLLLIVSNARRGRGDTRAVGAEAHALDGAGMERSLAAMIQQ